MSTIGTFTKSDNGYAGTVRTLNVNGHPHCSERQRLRPRAAVSHYGISTAWRPPAIRHCHHADRAPFPPWRQHRGSLTTAATA